MRRKVCGRVRAKRIGRGNEAQIITNKDSGQKEEYDKENSTPTRRFHYPVKFSEESVSSPIGYKGTHNGKDGPTNQHDPGPHWVNVRNLIIFVDG
jgi:hypothetical protein